MAMTRRQFLVGAAGGCGALMLAPRRLYAAETPGKIRIGACDWSMRTGGPEALKIGKGIGLDGVEASAGEAADVLKIADPAVRQEYKKAMQEIGIPVSSVAMGLLNNYPLASEPRAVAWMGQTIEAAQDLGGKVILVAFFGKGDLRKGKELKTGEVDAVVERLKEVAPKAEKAGVILGLENTLSGAQNLAILERVKSDAVRIYYDVGNSTDNGYDVPAEIRALRDRICQFHFKDGGHYLGEGKVAMPPVAEAIHAIDYKGWIVLETSIPSKDRDADFKKNADFVRKLIGIA
jgi:sugar phosphate isomerase/epimerase